MKNKNLHLLISVIIIIAAALVYGLQPKAITAKIFDFGVSTIDLAGIFKAMMGLYISLAVFWTIGIMRPGLWFAATCSNIFFMAGLAAGRIFSLMADGTPSPVFLFGLFLEIALLIWGIVNLKIYKAGRS